MVDFQQGSLGKQGPWTGAVVLMILLAEMIMLAVMTGKLVVMISGGVTRVKGGMDEGMEGNVRVRVELALQ